MPQIDGDRLLLGNVRCHYQPLHAGAAAKFVRRLVRELGVGQNSADAAGLNCFLHPDEPRFLESEADSRNAVNSAVCHVCFAAITVLRAGSPEIAGSPSAPTRQAGLDYQSAPGARGQLRRGRAVKCFKAAFMLYCADCSAGKTPCLSPHVSFLGGTYKASCSRRLRARQRGPSVMQPRCCCLSHYSRIRSGRGGLPDSFWGGDCTAWG